MARNVAGRRPKSTKSRASLGGMTHAPGVCLRCFREEFLHDLVAKQRRTVSCVGCSSRKIGVTLEFLAEELSSVLDELYLPAPTEPSGLEWISYRETGDWARPGRPLRDIFESMLGVRSEVAGEICDFMAEKEGGWKVIADGGELSFDADVWYEERSGFFDLGRHLSFADFERTLRHSARYFHPPSRALLQSIFNGVHSLVSRAGDSVCVRAGPGSNYQKLFRARVFEDEDALMKAMTNPALDLGPPPPPRARAGRMNAELVSMFYGATDAGTALAEVRPPAHSRVLVGQFELLRELHLLDVEAMREVLIVGSPLDRGYRERLRHADFLRTLSQRISRPVLPSQQSGDYLATQAIADFLAHEIQPPLDGIIYPTSQGSVGMNVVLFAGASRVEEQEREEGVYFESETSVMTEDGPETEYSVFEWRNDSRAPPLRPKYESDWEDGRPVTLRVRRESLEVREVVSVRFETINYGVNNVTLDRSELKDF
jgi:hypothetical protein